MLSVTMLSPAERHRREVNGEQAGIRETPPLWMPADSLAARIRSLSNEGTLRNTTYSVNRLNYVCILEQTLWHKNRSALIATCRIERWQR